MAHGILAAYLCFMALDRAIALWLNELNMRHFRAWKRTRPDTDDKSFDYGLAHARFGRVAMIWRAVFRLLQLFILLPPLLAAARALAGHLPGIPYAEGLLFCLGYSATSWAAGLPLDLYSTFVLEQRFGFNRMNWRLYAVDELKSGALTLALAGPVLWFMFLLIERGGPHWWLWAFGLSCLLDLILQAAGPALIEPLFHRFEELPEGELRRRTLALSEKTGFHARKILVKDASRRTGHSNAYFSGFGPFKRIVFYDTLLSEMTVEQNEGVLAHELGHWKLGHILELKVLDLAVRLLDLWIFSLALGWEPLSAAFGLPHSVHAVFVTYGVVAMQIFFWRRPLMNVLYRRQERDADRFAAETVGGGEALAAALDRLAAQNLDEMPSHHWHHAYYSSHPRREERAAALRQPKK